MKLLKSIIICGLGLAATMQLASCNDWLDVNTDPDNPSAESTTYDQRLAHIEFYTNSAIQFGAWRTTMAMGDWTRNYSGGNYWHVSYWYPVIGQVTTSYQWWFVGAYANVPDMIEKAHAAGHYQYEAVGYIIKAYGFMAMTDLYGEMPYYEAAGESATPTYNSGRTIYLGCLNDIDKAIDLLETGGNLASNLPSLATGDWWNNGDASKWLKLAYLLKARWINKLIKKGDGSYLDGKYDASTILACLDKAMQSNSDNTIVHHKDGDTSRDVLGWNEPVDYSPLFSVSGMNSGYMPTKMLYDNLTNFGGYGVEDPRADHVLPWAYCVKKGATEGTIETDSQGIKWNGNWRRSLGVDMASDINSKQGPARAAYDTETDSWYINTDDPERKGDTVYVEGTSYCKVYFNGDNIIYYRAGRTCPNSAESGTFYTRVSSPTYVGTYAEACFIRAEVYMRQGNKTAAYEAYKKGVQASCELMNEQLNTWISEDANLASNPSFTPMTTEAINNYVNTGIGTASDLTMGHILTQKRLALMFSIEIWNDMRRYDFNTDYFFGWSIPAYHYKVASAMDAIPNGKQYRRWRQCSHEYNYNATNLQAIGDSVPGANLSVKWNEQPDTWTINVWWDSDQGIPVNN